MTRHPRPAPDAHLAYLDGLRALAALYVVVHHLFYYVDPTAIPAVEIAREVFRHGLYAVDVFIMLSGFCLMRPVVRGDGTIRHGLPGFFARRARRILPPYYLAMLLCLALIAGPLGAKTGRLWDDSLPVTAGSVLTHLLLVQDAAGDTYKINYVFWSIAVEWRIYFLFPLLVWAWRRLGAGRTTVAAAVGSGLLYLAGRRFLGVTLSIHYLGLFALGMLGASIAFDDALRFARARRLPWTAIAAGFLALLAIYTEVWAWSGLRLPFEAGEYLAGLSGMALLVAASTSPSNRLAATLGARPLAALGAFAYSLYLVHAPVLQLVWRYLVQPTGAGPLATLATMLLVAIPITLALSYLFFLTCERPFLRRAGGIKGHALPQPHHVGSGSPRANVADASGALKLVR